MAIRKENKFDNAVAELNEQEAVAEEKSQKVMKNISGELSKLPKKEKLCRFTFPKNSMNNLTQLRPLTANPITPPSWSLSGIMLPRKRVCLTKYEIFP